MKKKIICTIVLILSLLCFYVVQFFSNVNVDLGNSNWLITHHNYDKTKDDTQNIYIIFKEGNLLRFEKHNVKDNELIIINAPIGREFKVSLYGSKTIEYKWKIDSEINQQIVSYLGENYVNTAKNIVNLKIKKLESNRRQNLNFYAKDMGVTTINLKYINDERNEINMQHKLIINVTNRKDTNVK